MFARAAAAAPRTTRLVVRSNASDAVAPVAAPVPAPVAAPAGESVFYAGKQVSVEEFESRRAELLAAAAAEVVRAPEPPTFGELMAFSGPAPELVNVSAPGPAGPPWPPAERENGKGGRGEQRVF